MEHHPTERTPIMKLSSKPLIGSILIVTCCLSQAMGAPTASQKLNPTVASVRPAMSPSFKGEIDGPKLRFAELIGQEVFNFQNERLGRIKAMTADLSHSRLVEVLVSTRSGMLWLHETITPVPPTAFTINSDGDVVRLNMSKERFAAAPKLPAMNTTVYAQTDRAAASSRYFGVKPWFEPGGLGHIETTGAIRLMQIKSPQGKYLGQVGTLLLDLHTGRINQVVDATESFDRNGNRVLSPSALTYNAKHDALVLNETLPQLANAPHFRWAQGYFGAQEFVEEIPRGRHAPSVRATSPVASMQRRGQQRTSLKTTVASSKALQPSRFSASATTAMNVTSR